MYNSSSISALKRVPESFTEKFIEACVIGSPCTKFTSPTGRTEDLSEESIEYRIRTNGASDLSAAALLLKLSTLNTRVTLTRTTPPVFSTSQKLHDDFEYDIEASRRGLLDESVTSNLTMQSAAYNATKNVSRLQPTGDATEVGIYK